MTSAEIQALVREARTKHRRIYDVDKYAASMNENLCDAIESLLARDNIRTFAEQEVRIAELERERDELRQLCESYENALRARGVLADDLFDIAEGRDNG